MQGRKQNQKSDLGNEANFGGQEQSQQEALGQTPDPSFQPEQEGSTGRQMGNESGGDRSGAQSWQSEEEVGRTAGNQQTGQG